MSNRYTREFLLGRNKFPNPIQMSLFQQDIAKRKFRLSKNEVLAEEYKVYKLWKKNKK